MTTLTKPRATVVRVLLDFALGIILFSLAVATLTAGHGAAYAASTAQAGSQHWLTAIYPADTLDRGATRR